MKKTLVLLAIIIHSTIYCMATNILVESPDKNLGVNITLNPSGELLYNIKYKNKTILEDSPLGLISDVSDFSKNLTLINIEESIIDKQYTQDKIKRSNITYRANKIILDFHTPKKEKISLIMQVSNNDIAFKYKLDQNGETARCIIKKETTGFKFPSVTTTFLTPQALPMIGWMQTKPSYEEEYIPDEPLATPSKYGVGYTFPALFHIGDNGWALISETGVNSLYCASKLSECNKDGLYTIAFPEPGENNGIGLATPAISLPGETPWRTITISDDLQPIVETTIPFDVVEPLYAPSTNYKFGRSTWSWIMWQDNSINYDDQIAYIDLAANLGYEYVLIDGLWDKQIGYENLPKLFAYAQSKGVDVFLWYNSNGYWNDAPQGAKQRMHTSVVRKKEMKWLKEHGVKGIKVDFFGGDKQETMKLYEDILSDANDYGLMVIFHGCTLPRGWERMYPNFVGSEAVLASENLIFSQHANDNEAYNATLHPFIRNSVASMEFGPVLLNKRHNRSNNGGQIRKTTDIFQLATAVLFQNPVQMFAIAPNNLTEYPDFIIDFMKNIPTTWDETVFIDGYPGKYVVLARRHEEKWYIAGINAESSVRKITLDLPMIPNESTVSMYSDQKDRTPQLKNQTIKNGKITINIEPQGAVIISN